MQISVVDGPSPTLTNAGDATLNGGELELSWKVSRAFTLAAYSSYLDAEYDSLTQRALNSGVTLNSRLPNVSKRSEEHTSELQSLMRISYAVFCLKNKNH